MENVQIFTERLSSVLPFSRYLQREVNARPWLLPLLADTFDRALTVTEMRTFLERYAPDEPHLQCGMRRLRTWVVCHIASRDLLGLAPLSEVTGAMSLLAEVSLLHACNILHARLADTHGSPTGSDGDPLQMTIIGMGKLGGHELNVSSDIDLIFLYPEEGETAGPRPVAHYDFFARLGRLLIAAISEVTEDGFVFRVDMRLRPNGDSGPLAMSFDALEHYFISQGREWERFAWIKARPLCGSRLGELLAIVRPFVFRKYFDFGAINALRKLHKQIRAQVVRREMAMNIKLGPGGIREIEFIAQVFQIIRGGRDAGLQVKATLQVLAALGERGLLPVATVAELTEAYIFLRRLEHRLQYLDDAQTHDLPASADDRRRLASAMKFPDEAAMLLELGRHRQRVNVWFQSACGDPNETEHHLDELWDASFTDDHAERRLAALNFRNPGAVKNQLVQLRQGSCYRQLPESIRITFDVLVPRIIECCAAQAQPDTALARSLTLMETISRRGAYLALLHQYPEALYRTVELLSVSSWASDYLTRHPILLDELLDGRHLDMVTDWTDFARRLREDLDAAEPDTERQMDLMREQHHAQVFRILHQDLAGKWRVEAIGDQLSALADVVLGETLRQCWHKCQNRHRRTPKFAVIGYGKLGGKELGYASDLDIVFLYNDDNQTALENYARLAQRMLTWLSSRTSAGTLFEIDTRLRPNGRSGLLVSHLDAFLKYQNESARLWEHQALTRARFVAGDASVGKAFESEREAILRRPRHQAALGEEILAMRRRLLDSHASKVGGFSVKDDVGGLIDFEFIIQYLVLGNAHAHPELVANLGNIALARIAGALGLIDAQRAQAAADGYRTLRRMQHRLRLNGEKALLPQGEIAEARQAIIDLWLEVFGRPA
jgi:glutamate-ammonia-ligase adenylyltransferase